MPSAALAVVEELAGGALQPARPRVEAGQRCASQRRQRAGWQAGAVAQRMFLMWVSTQQRRLVVTSS